MYKKLAVLLASIIGIGSVNCFAMDAEDKKTPPQAPVSFSDSPYPIYIGRVFLAHPAEIAKVLKRPHRPSYTPRSRGNCQTVTATETVRSNNSTDNYPTIPFEG